MIAQIRPVAGGGLRRFGESKSSLVSLRSSLKKGIFGVMVASKGETAIAVPLDEVAGKRKTVPPDHDWIKSARAVGTCMGD